MKETKREFSKFVALFIFFFVVVADQVSKYYAVNLLTLGSSVNIVSGFFSFSLTYNPGAAFGIFSDMSDLIRRVFLIFVSLVATCIVIRFFMVEAKNDPFSKYALVGILGGGVGNLIDRVRFDAVIDFLDFYIGSYHWPAFNVADSAICIGVFLLMYRTFKSGFREDLN